MDNWTSILQSKIHSNIKNRFPEDLKLKYPEIDFVTVDRNLKEPRFPTVKTKLIPMVERGQDLEGTSINAVLVTVQIDVTTNQSVQDVQTVAYAVVSILKTMRFTVIAFPDIDTEDDGVHHAVIRARRVIGSEDAI